MSAALGRRAAHRRGRPALRPEPPLLGDRRQRRQPIAAEEMRIKLSELCYKSIACDATEDKKHIDLSSEPLILVCAAGLDRLDRRRRGQGGRHLPGPQGGADRDRHRGRGALRGRAPGHRRCPATHPRWPSCCRPWPATSSATRPRWPSTPRPARCARPAPPSRRPSPAGRAGDGDDLLGRAAADARAAGRPGSSTACAAATTTATSRPAPRCGWRRCSATRSASLPLEAYQVEYGKVGTPERRRRGPHRRAHAGPSRSSPARSTPSSTRPRRSPSASPARDESCSGAAGAGGAGRRRRRATGSATGRCARWPTSTRRSPRSSASPATASRATRRRRRAPRVESSTAAASRREHPVAHRARPACCGAPSTASRSSGEVLVARGPQRRPHGAHRARGEGRPVHRAHAAARPLRRPPAGWPRCAAVLQGYRNRYAALEDAVTETEPTFRDDLLADVPVVDLLTEPVNDLADRWRVREPCRERRSASASTWSTSTASARVLDAHARRSSTGCSPPTSRRTAEQRAAIPTERYARAVRGQGGGDEGARRRARRVSAFRDDRGRAGRVGRARRCVLHGTAAALAGRARRARAWHAHRSRHTDHRGRRRGRWRIGDVAP